MYVWVSPTSASPSRWGGGGVGWVEAGEGVGSLVLPVQEERGFGVS